MVNQAARNKKKKAKKQAAARQDTGSTTEAEQDAYLAAAHAQAQLERERLALEHQRRAALVEAAAAAEFQGRQLQHGSYHVAPDGTVYDEHGELMEDEDDEEEDDEEDEDDLDDEDLEDEEDDDEDDEDEDDDDLLDEDEELRIEVDHQVLQEHQRYIRQQQQAQSQQQQQSRSRQPSSTTAAAATHEALLGTANDLYKQIENAAAAALSGAHAGQQRGGNAGVNAASFSTSLFPAATGGEEDDAYWLSLPSHLRSFIRSALPLAAGLSTSPQSQQQQQQGGNNGLPTAQQINLTPDQMAAAAAQLAQVVQNGWASTLAKEPLDSPLRSALLNAQQQQANAQSGQRGSGNSTTTTIPLGAFALPLHPHPDSPEAAAAFQAAAQAAAQAAVGGGNNNGSNGGNQASTLPFPSLANLQASLLQLAKMPPGDLASHPGFPGNPFTAPMSNNTEGVPSPQMPQQAAGESKSSKKKKKKQASQAAAAAAAASIPTPQQQQPPMPAQPMQPIPERQYAPLRTSKISPVNTKASSPVNAKAPSPVNSKAPPPPARVATPNNGKQPAQQPPPSNGKSVANGKQPAVAPAPVRSDSGKGRQIPIQNTAPSSTSPVNNPSAQQQQQYQQQPQTGIRPTPSAVANGKRPLIATRSAVPVVPSAPAKSVTGNTINNPPAPPPVAQQPHDRDNGKKRATRESVPTPTTASTAYGGGPTASSSTSSGERAKIRDFWLGLSERDRRDLVKVEKDAVLKKMKEQQRHGCTCAVCVRKRQAIEVELEVLYDAYYDELESYAHHQKAYEKSKGMDPKIPPPLGPGPFPGSVDIEKMVTSPMTSSNTQQQQAQPLPSTKSASNNAYTAPKKNSNPNTGNNSPVKGKTQPPPPPATANTAAAKTTANAQSKDKHSHSPSCPHYPHTHDHKHHHHHAPTSKDRGKATQNAPPVAAGRKHHHHHHHHRDDEEDYISDEDEYDDEDDEGEYDDEDDYDGEDDIPETDEEDMPPLEGMDSADEAPPQPPLANPPGGRRGTHPPVAQPRRNTAPPPKAAQQQPAQVAKKDVGAPNSGGDFFGFGSSLTVKGILTVAEDLLKNDGQKFLEMMESLADKRIQRERAAVDGFSESEYEDDEEEEEYDEEEEEEEEDEDELDEEDGEGVEEPLTEEQKMEEGRRMFQVFAARMFEQRVLTAYREKIAQERQMQLLRELEEEDRQAAEREAKKAKDAQKKKDKKKLAKQQKDQERLQAETDRLAAEAAAKAEAEAKAEEERRRAEESRAKREAEKKAKEAELLRRSELKKTLLAEEARKRKEEKDRAREAKLQREKEEQERKAQKEKDEAERRAKREEQERKDRAAREAKEREAAAKKAQLEAEKAAKEKAEREKQEKEAAAKAAARASPLNARQVPGQTPRSTSSKVIPGMPKPPAPPTPSPAPSHAVNATGPGVNGAQHGASMHQTPLQKPGQTPQHMPFSSNSFVSGLSATSPMTAGRPSFGNPTFGQQAPIGFSSGSQHAYPQTSFGTIDAMSPNQSQRSAPGPPGIGGPGRIVSPSHQQHQGFNGPPGMQIPGSVSPMASQRSPFTSFGAASNQPGMHPGATSPFSSARNHVNGVGSTLSPGPNTAPLAAGQGVTQPMPIGRGHASASRASPGSGHPGSASLNSSSFQHSASGLAALNMDSQVVQRSGFAPSSQQNQSSMPPGAPHSAAPGHARKASQSSVHPIGRPASRFGSEAGSFGAMGMSDFLSSADEDPAGTSASSLRSISPPPAVLGSGALLDDMMEEEGLDLAPDMASPALGARPGVSQSSSAAFFGNSVFGPPMLGGPPSKAADDVWASTPASSSHDNPSKGASWNSGPQPPMMAQPAYGSNPFHAPAPQIVPDRGSVIRDRAKIAFTQLDTAYSTQSAGRSSNYPIGDVYRVFLALYPDSASVDVREFLESCLVPGTVINGNGTFSFQQQGQVLLMNYEASKTDGEYLPFGPGQTAEPIGAR